VYNATSNELVRTNTLVKGCIVQIDATPFKQWYEHFYRVQLGKVKKDDSHPGTSAKKTDDKPAAAAAPKKDTPKSSVQKSGKKEAPKKEAVKKSDKTTTAPKKDAPKSSTASSGKKDDKKDSAKAAADAKAALKATKLRRKTAEEIKKAIDSGVRKPSHRLKRKLNSRNKTRVIENALKDQFNTGRVLAKISSRPGQSGRADGYILEGEELNFYIRKIEKKRKE
jgi:ribosomal protein S8E